MTNVPERAEAEERAMAAWLAVGEAEDLVAFEWKALQTLREFTTEQLRLLVWVGLLDTGWRRIFYELDRRGETL